MSDQEVAVKLSADVKSLLQGMKDAQEHTETAVAGMKGDLGSMIESFEHFGAGALAIGALGLALEGLKEGVATINEAVHATDEMARSFETLHMRTGASYEDLTVYKNAMVLTGGSMDDFSGLLTGLARKMSANSEIYIANGIAANKNALDHQDLMVTLAKSVKVIAGIEEPGRRAEMAIALLGGRAQGMLPQIIRMNEVIEKDGVEGLKKLGMQMDEVAEQKMKKLEHTVGTTKLAIEAMDQKLADSGRGWANWGNQIHLAWLRVLDVVTLGDGELPDTPKPGESKDGHAGGGEGGKDGGGTTTPGGVTPKELEARKKAHEDRITIARATAAEELKIAAENVDAVIAVDKHLVAMEVEDFDDMIATAKEGAQIKLEAQQTAAAKEIKLAEGNAVLIAGIKNKLADDERKFTATIAALNDEAEKHWKETEDKKAKEATAVQKIVTTGALNASKDELAAQKLALEARVSMGQITVQQEMAQRKALLAAETALDVQYLQDELKQANLTLTARTTIEEKILALKRKTALETTKLEQAAVAASKARWDGFFQSMTGGVDSAVQGLVKGTMTWGNAFKAVTDQALTGLISFFVRWGEEEAIKWATSLAMGETGRVTEAEGAAAVYAINAMASVAAIPMIGWAMAPGVGAEAYGSGLAFAGLASAAGGWERVPSDQLAQIHKNEMVLPAHIAEPVRQMAARGGGGGDVHFHGTSAGGFFIAHQSELIAALRSANRNGRIG